VKIAAGSELSLVSGNFMSRRNQLSWEWRHMARKSAMFLATLFHAEHVLQYYSIAQCSDFANTFVFLVVNSRAKLIPSQGAPRRWLGDKLNHTYIPTCIVIMTGKYEPNNAQTPDGPF
jgi:hypothetical protein